MADIDGLLKKRISLVAGVPQKIMFAYPICVLDIALMGSGQVAFSDTKNITSVSDNEANFVSEEVPIYQLYKSYGIKQLTFCSDTSTVIQWNAR